MAKITEAMNALFDSANTVAGVVNDYTTKQATLSTQTKNIQLQTDINGKLAQIKQSANPENWNTEINGFFEQIKSGMSNPDSPYYCKNNLQAEMFNKILDQNQVNVSEHVNNLVMQRQSQERIVNVQNAKAQLAQMYSGQEYIDKCNELDRGLYEGGDIGPEDYQKQMDINYLTGYRKMHTDVFDASFNTALEKGKSAEAFWQDIKGAVPELKAKDIKGLEKVYDKTATDESIKKEALQYYNARLSDVQQGNANKLSEIEQQMRQNNTAEGKVNIALKGQREMNNMLGLQLSENDRRKYASVFELGLNGGVKGSSSGSGSSSKKPDETFANFCKAQPDEAVELLSNHDDLLPYDAAQIVSDRMVREWFTGNYKENYDEDYDERLKDYNEQYQSTTSVNTVTNAMINKLVDKYPTAANYLKNNCTKLINDMQNNPKEYGEASAGELADFMRDWVMSAPASATDDDFKTALSEHVNNCYIERCKYIELKDSGKLKDTFNVKKPADIAKAAQMASSKDFVFTDTQGNERWAKGKKEALEAPGGIVNVLQNAVVGTLGIPESEYKDIGFYYQRDESGHDMTSKPIITYKDKAYEVIANDDGKGFTVRDINTNETYEGKAGGKLQEVMRKDQKAEAKQDVKDAASGVASLKKEREEEVNKAITASTSIPKAMKAVGTIEKEEWENVKTVENRTTYLNITERKINNDASKVEKNKMTADEFKKKYGIDYSDWNKTGERTAHYKLILES